MDLEAKLASLLAVGVFILAMVVLGLIFYLKI